MAEAERLVSLVTRVLQALTCLELLGQVEEKFINGMMCLGMRFGSMNDVMGGKKKGFYLDGAGFEQGWIGTL